MKKNGWNNMRYSITNEQKDIYKTTSDMFVSDLYTGNTDSNTLINLYSCGATFGGWGENGSIGGAFSFYFGVPVYGSNGSVHYDGIEPYTPWYWRVAGYNFDWVYDKAYYEFTGKKPGYFLWEFEKRNRRDIN